MKASKPSPVLNTDMPIPNETEKVAKIMLGAAFVVHSAMGPVLLESVYELCLAHEKQKRGCKVQTQVSFIYNDLRMDAGYRLDLLVDDKIVVEIKSVEQLLPVHQQSWCSFV